MKKTFILFIFLAGIFFSAHAQFGGLGKILVDKGAQLAGGNVNKLIKQPAAITTNFKDVDLTGKQAPSFKENETAQPLYLLPKATGGGYKLCAGYYTMTNKSYCLQAGTRGPSHGDGYMLLLYWGLSRRWLLPS